MENVKKAIVFAGGGSKGAYQLGAWKALNELGECFDIATGTSIGSINAAFYVQKDFGPAEQMWGEITAGDIMANGINFDVSFESIISQRDNLIPFLKNYLNTKSVDNTPFINMIHKYFSPEKFFSSEIDYALVTVNYKGLSRGEMFPVTVEKSEMAAMGENAWQWISASSACYPVFPPVEIDGELYIDGGFYDNIPVAAAINLGAKEIVVVDLNTENNHEGYIHHPSVKYIRPSKDLGGFLNFDRSVLDRSIRLGYCDTMKVYGKYLGTKYTFIPDENGFGNITDISEIFTDILTAMEAAFDFSSKVRFHRVNKLMGCTGILGEYCDKKHPEKCDIFIAAFELLLSALGYDDEEQYNLGELLYTLKNEADRIYPLLEFDTDSSFKKVHEFIKGFNKAKDMNLKKYDEDRIMLIYTSVLRALQRAKL